jgi:hypothetical protein
MAIYLKIWSEPAAGHDELLTINGQFWDSEFQKVEAFYQQDFNVRTGTAYNSKSPTKSSLIGHAYEHDFPTAKLECTPLIIAVNFGCVTKRSSEVGKIIDHLIAARKEDLVEERKANGTFSEKLDGCLVARG